MLLTDGSQTKQALPCQLTTHMADIQKPSVRSRPKCLPLHGVGMKDFTFPPILRPLHRFRGVKDDKSPLLFGEPVPSVTHHTWGFGSSPVTVKVCESMTRIDLLCCKTTCMRSCLLSSRRQRSIAAQRPAASKWLHKHELSTSTTGTH